MPLPENQVGAGRSAFLAARLRGVVDHRGGARRRCASLGHIGNQALIRRAGRGVGADQLGAASPQFNEAEAPDLYSNLEHGGRTQVLGNLLKSIAPCGRSIPDPGWSTFHALSIEALQRLGESSPAPLTSDSIAWPLTSAPGALGLNSRTGRSFHRQHVPGQKAGPGSLQRMAKLLVATLIPAGFVVRLSVSSPLTFRGNSRSRTCSEAIHRHDWSLALRR